MRCTVAGEPHWCLKHLVHRIHRRMLDTRRGNWQAPASAEACWRFLAQWQGVGGHRRTGRDGLVDALRQLAALELPADAWCRLVMPARISDVRPEWLDELTLAGEFAWGRLWRGSEPADQADPDARPARSPPLIRTTPITLIPRSELPAWLRLAGPADAAGLSGYGQAVVAAIDRGGALFTADLAERTRLLPDHLERGLGEAIAAGLITADSFAALRWLLLPSERRAKARPPAGRWCRFRSGELAESHADPTSDAPANDADAALVAQTLLGRTGVVMRRLYDRERIRLPWREVHRALRVMELRGECLGGRFVAGLGGEQFALPAAAATLRQVANAPPAEPIALSAADPLNYTGILIPGDRVRAAAGETITVG